MNQGRNGVLFLAAACVLFAPLSGAGGLEWKEGDWRLELSGYSGIHQGSRNRGGDFNVTAAIEYEAPLWEHATLGLRLHPLFYYQDDTNNEDIFGLALGPTFRLYHKGGEERRGLFLEGGVSVLAHDGKFSGNSGNVNFLSELGVGYKFKNDVHISVQWRHISNAGLSERNAGVNGVGLGIGFTF